MVLIDSECTILQYKFEKFPGGGGVHSPDPLAFFITFSNTGQFFLSLG